MTLWNWVAVVAFVELIAFGSLTTSRGLHGVALVLAINAAFALMWAFNRAWIARPFTRLMNADVRGHPAEHWVGLGLLVAIFTTAAVRAWIMVR